MYKTVRHGENSLQYRILAQQEEGLPGVKRRKSSKIFIAKIMAIATLLIILIMASAFVVPLLLGNDFIAVTGAFQKFSVSTLRRSHSGNHVVVIAKKPHGWNGGHPTMPPRLLNATQTTDNVSEKTPAATKPPHKTSETTGTRPSTAQTTTTTPMTTRTTTTVSSTEETTTTKILTVEVTPLQVREYKGTTNPTPERPIDFDMKTMMLHYMYLISGFVIFVGFVKLCKILLRKPEKEKPESKEDKRKLLKPTASSDPDEE